jgi:Spy/CpxP family protein refolding chaperone
MKRIIIASCTVFLAAMGICVAQETPSPNRLSESQKQAFEKARQAAEGETKTKSEAITLKLAAIAKELDRNILADPPDPNLDKKLQNELIQAVSEMISGMLQLKMSVDREVVKILTPEQKKILLAELAKDGSNPDLTQLVGKLFVE